MNPTTKKLFQFVSIYYAACGLTSIFTPEVWYIVAGPPASDSNLILHVVGGLMLGLSYGAWTSAKESTLNSPMCVTFIVANFSDFLVVLAAMFKGALPIANGSGFLALDGVLIALLVCALRRD